MPTPLEQAQDLIDRNPNAPDIDAQLDRLQALAPAYESEMFNDLREAVIVAQSIGKRDG